jgi:hypothetical protein
MTSTLVLDGMKVPIETGGSSRRARLTIERDGSLLLRAAEDVATSELQAFLASKRDWIYRKLAEKEALEFEPVTKELVDGEGFLYLGRSHRLQIIRTSNPRVRMERGRLVLPQALQRGGFEQIIAWYQARALAWVRPRLDEWTTRLRVEPGSLEVADLGYKWGTATPGGHVRLHWAAMQLRPSLIDYVLAHELAHLREPHHGPAFWLVLGRALPDYEARKAELARVGGKIWLGAGAKEQSMANTGHD